MSKRRDLLKALSVAGAAGAVDTWKTPVVDGLSLPAHAKMTPDGTVFTLDVSTADALQTYCAVVSGNTVSITAYFGGHCMSPVRIAKFQWSGSAPMNGTGTLSVQSSGPNCRTICPFSTPDKPSRDVSVSMSGPNLVLEIEGGVSPATFSRTLFPSNQCSDPALVQCTSCNECL